MARGQLQSAFGDQIDKGTARWRGGFMDRSHHILILMRAGDREHFREACADQLGLISHAASDNHAAIFGNRLSNRLKAFFLGTVEESAGIDQYDIGPLIIGRHRIAIGAQFGEDTFAIDERLGAAQ
jgi:hypothetical protein